MTSSDEARAMVQPRALLTTGVNPGGSRYTPGEYAIDHHTGECRPFHGARRGERAPARRRGHDLRVVREPHRAIPEEDGRRVRRQRQPRDGAGDRPIRPGEGGPRRAGEGGRGRRLRRSAVRGWQRAPRATALDEPDEAALEHARAERALGIQALVSVAIALGIMVLMFWPGLGIEMMDLNRLVLWPATFVQFWAGGRSTGAAWRALRHRHGDDGHARLRSGRPPPGATACS